MAQEEAIKLFGAKKIRVVWDDQTEKYYFSIIDIIQVLTESADYQTARKYWNKLKQRLAEEGNETVTNCHQLKLTAADGKQRLTDVADTEQVLRLVQSVPSKKAEPFKLWLAQVGQERLNQLQDPEREGYRFTGWDKDFSAVKEDMTVKAQYEELSEGFEAVFSGENAAKILRNGQIYLLRGDRTYTLTGQEVK